MIAVYPEWLGRRDSNPRMPVPKTGALPLGHAPLFLALIAAYAAAATSGDYTGFFGSRLVCNGEDLRLRSVVGGCRQVKKFFESSNALFS